MPRKRNPENRGLPARWRHTHGGYYYQVPPGLEGMWDGKQTFLLGHSLSEAAKEWAKRLGTTNSARTVGQLLDRYELEVVPTKAPATQHSNRKESREIRNVFGHEPLESMTPQKVYQYMEKRSAKSRGRKELALLSHAYTKAVEWGFVERHPFLGQVRFAGAGARDRYVEDWEINEVMALQSERRKGSILMIQAYIRLKIITGMARSDMLRLQPGRDFREDGIHIQRHKTAKKTGQRTIYEWTPALRAAVADALAARPVDVGPWLFCNKLGECYINENTGEASGWDSMWGRFMARVLAETQITERFTEHDLRAKASSDADSDETARQMLSHASTTMTRRAYRRRPERVKPLR